MAYDSILDALGDPTRRRILEALRAGPLSVSDLAQTQVVSRPAVSQHLKALLDCNLVSFRAEGTRRVYALAPDGMTSVSLWVDQFWNP